MSDVTKDLLDALKGLMALPDHRVDLRDEAKAAKAAIARAEASLEPGRQTMVVWFGEMPESNGKMNWTTILYRRDGGLMDGVTIYRSEYKDRVRYEADRLRWLIGELEHRPNILAYDAELIVGAAPAEPQPDADGWIPWAGGECPVDANVEVIIKDRSGKVWHFGVAGDYDWNHDEEPLDILFYRIVEAQP